MTPKILIELETKCFQTTDLIFWKMKAKDAKKCKMRKMFVVDFKNILHC